MTNQIGLTLLLTTTCILTSCSSPININNYVDKTSPFNLTINNTDSATGLTKSTQAKIAVTSDKYLKLINWFDKNENGWQTTPPASYVTNISVTQGSFRLLYNKDADDVIVGFTDKNNNPRQYSKTIKKGELGFLSAN